MIIFIMSSISPTGVVVGKSDLIKLSQRTDKVCEEFNEEQFEKETV